MEPKLQKGYQMEELIRRYFLRSGHFAVRGIPFVYRGFEITDIDVWAYERPSPMARHRVVVDSKNRSTPKAIERIFWAKGLQGVLKVEQAIVATTDKRREVSDFGREHGIVILDGNFLDRLEKTIEDFDQRLTEEQFIALLASYRPIKEGGDWKSRVKSAKQPLVSDFGYNAINLWIGEANFFAGQMFLVPTHKQVACRVFYLMLSFVVIGTDFVLRDLLFSDSKIRFEMFNEGLRLGSPGDANTSKIMDLAFGLIEHYAPENRAVALKVRGRIKDDLDSIPTRMLAEYFCKPHVAQELFGIAKEFETAAYNTSFVPPHRLSVGCKAILGLFADFWNIDRTKFLSEQFSAASPVSESAPSAPPESKTGPSTAEQPELPGLEN